MSIVNINGKPYTTAAEDMRLEQLKHRFRELLSLAVTRAMQTAKGPKMSIDLREADECIDQAYYLGRDK